jgi:prolipoprotein diacylglyceryltransferase
MWFSRKKIHTAGVMTGLFMIFNGLERFFIEKIRVNTEYNIAGLGVSQAEIISFLLVIAGAYTLWFVRRKK